MGAGIQISVEEYLKTEYRPDRDYVDGVVEERNLGERDHSWIQANIVSYFHGQFRTTGIAALPEWRFQVKPTRFRVPDVVLTKGKPGGRILREPPLLCIEILSPEDTASRMNERVQDYLEFGVPAVWVIDPTKETVSVYRRSGMVEVAGGSLAVDGSDLEIPLTTIFE